MSTTSYEIPCLSNALYVALHCTHAGFVYTVMVIDTTPQRNSTRTLGTALSPSSADLPAPKFPASRALGTDASLLVSAARPTCELRGLSVWWTLHLVSHKSRTYNIFETTLMKFPGRKPSCDVRHGVSPSTRRVAIASSAEVYHRPPTSRPRALARSGGRPVSKLLTGLGGELPHHVVEVRDERAALAGMLAVQQRDRSGQREPVDDAGARDAERLAGFVVRPDAAEPAERRADHRERLAGDGVVPVRAGQPVDCVLHDGRDAAVVFGCHHQNRVGISNRGTQLRGRGRCVGAIDIFVVERHIAQAVVDGDGYLVGCCLGNQLGNLTIHRAGAQAPDQHQQLDVRHDGHPFVVASRLRQLDPGPVYSCWARVRAWSLRASRCRSRARPCRSAATLRATGNCFSMRRGG